MRFRSLLIRRNYDVFRVSTDFVALVLLYAIVLHAWISPLAFMAMLSVYFGCSLLYQLYFHVFHKIYHLDPVFFHDFLMLKTAAQIFVHEFSIRNLVMLLTTIGIGVLSLLLIYQLSLSAEIVSFGPGSWIVIVLFTGGALYSLRYPYQKYPFLTFQSQLQSVIRNLSISRRSKKSVAALTLRYMKQFNVDPGIQLASKPNVYFIVIESYGRLALEEEIPGAPDLQFMSALHRRLDAHGWHVSSGYTRSPVTGGASWISYTSMLYGLNVRNQGVYTTMLKNKYMQDFDSLFHWLKRQGYLTFRVSSLGGYEKMEIPYDSYSRLYGIDHWIKYNDLEYTGAHYGFGPSPPDQYAIWKGDELCSEIAADTPKALFFITQNSHTPYESPDGVAEDWRRLNDGSYTVKKPSAFWSRPKFERYGQAIRYQLDALTDFIVSKQKADDIFILVGDHQPPSLSRAVDNFDTPMHVISRDQEFIQHWEAYGLVPGMLPDRQKPVMRQEAVHWAMLRALISSRAVRYDALPHFLEEGIPY